MLRLSKYIVDFVLRLYPDAQDIPSKRVLIKIDSGPGRMFPELQQRLRARGIYMFPGVPNGTEVGQEMDQMYSYAKGLCYRNREKLIRARHNGNPNDTSPLGLADIGWLIFGGTVTVSDGSTVELEPAFDLAFVNGDWYTGLTCSHPRDCRPPSWPLFVVLLQLCHSRTLLGSATFARC